jgi:hypothetical protein
MIQTVRRCVPCLLLAFLLAAGAVGAQTAQDMLASYKRNFVIAGLDTKLQIIQDAGRSGGRELGPLYLQAVDYVLENFSLLETDQRFRALGVAAVDLLRAAGYADARFSVLKLFQTDNSRELRVSCLNALGVIGRGDAEIVNILNLWLAAQNTVFRTGKVPDVPVIFAAVKALGGLADGSSFPVLFTTMNLGYTADVTNQAREALQAISGDYKQLFLGVLRDSPLPEKLEALNLALSYERLNESEKGEIAEFALDVGLHTAAADNQLKASARDLRFAAARALAQRKWSKATPLAIENFDAVVLEYERALADRRFVLEAIELLGSVGSHEAAVRLTQYLIYLNSYTERLRSFDSAIVLAVVQSLGRLGDKVAFDDLLYVDHLPSYSNEIKAAARKARSSLKW